MRYVLDPLSPTGISKAESKQGYQPYFAGGPGKPSLLDSINGLHGAPQIVAGDNIEVTTEGKNIVITGQAGGPGGSADWGDIGGDITDQTDLTTYVTGAVDTAMTTLKGTAEAALDTLGELSDAIGDDANYAATVTTNLATKLAKASNLSDVASAATSFSNIKQNATTSATGVVQLTNDLGGTATAPTIKRAVRYTVTRDSTRLADYTCDGTADDVQIQAAIDAANSAGGGTVVLLAGTNAYRIATTITLPENVSLVGERMARQSSGGVTLKTAASVTLTNMFEMTGSSNPANNAALKHDVQMAQITIEGNNTTTNGIMLTNQDTIKLDNVRIITCTNSINTTWDHTSAPGAGNIPGGLYLNNCNISTTGTGIGVILNYQTQCWINNSWFTASSGTPTAWIKFNASNKIKVSNVEFNTATTALWFTDVDSGGALDFACHNITVDGAVFATGGTVITDDRTDANSGYVHISGTMANGTTQGDDLVGSGNSIILGSVNKFSGDVSVADEAYGSGWNGSTEVPTKNAVYDKIETLSGGGVSESLAIAYAVAL